MKQFSLGASFTSEEPSTLEVSVQYNGSHISIKFRDEEIHLAQKDIIRLVSEIADGMEEGYIHEIIDKLLGKLDSVAVPWSIQDVYNMRDDLDSNQAKEVLDYIKENHCSGQGINYHVIEETAQKLYPL